VPSVPTTINPADLSAAIERGARHLIDHLQSDHLVDGRASSVDFDPLVQAGFWAQSALEKPNDGDDLFYGHPSYDRYLTAEQITTALHAAYANNLGRPECSASMKAIGFDIAPEERAAIDRRVCLAALERGDAEALYAMHKQTSAPGEWETSFHPLELAQKLSIDSPKATLAAAADVMLNRLATETFVDDDFRAAANPEVTAMVGFILSSPNYLGLRRDPSRADDGGAFIARALETFSDLRARTKKTAPRTHHYLQEHYALTVNGRKT
jgi:hypothetical protein